MSDLMQVICYTETDFGHRFVRPFLVVPSKDEAVALCDLLISQLNSDMLKKVRDWLTKNNTLYGQWQNSLTKRYHFVNFDEFPNVPGDTFDDMVQAAHNITNLGCIACGVIDKVAFAEALVRNTKNFDFHSGNGARYEFFGVEKYGTE